ncbi:hypothetical protein SAMN06296386_1233 [Lachnospiraceae bacterium]|nr:hypothetical protein SAMN06296386_1233 [Lachnospiraceae bacterium]
MYKIEKKNFNVFMDNINKSTIPYTWKNRMRPSSFLMKEDSRGFDLYYTFGPLTIRSSTAIHFSIHEDDHYYYLEESIRLGKESRIVWIAFVLISLIAAIFNPDAAMALLVINLFFSGLIVLLTLIEYVSGKRILMPVIDDFIKNEVNNINVKS